MKKLILNVLLLMSIFLIGCYKNADIESDILPGSSSSTSGSSEDNIPPAQETVKTYKITYQWNEYGTVYNGIENFPKAMTNGLEIPMEYIEGTTVALPRLNVWKKNVKIVYEFEGWYFDETLKSKVMDNLLPATQTGDITLYAKLVAYVN